MAPADFVNAYLRPAAEVSAGTGIEPFVLLAQWANETQWGQVVVGNNLGNIRCGSTTFCRYATLDDFAAACVATWHNGNYGAVLAAVGPAAQLAAICASPWSSGHYGGSLQPFYSPLEVYVSQLDDIQANVAAMYPELRGGQETLTQEINDLKAAIAAVKAAITTPAPATVDFTPVLAAINTNTAAINAVAAKLASLTLKAV